MRKILSLIVVFLVTQGHAATQGMVVSEHHLASQVGVDILKAGGNAIDAAVAVGYALAVVNPCCGNIGGGGFMVIHLANGKNIFVNFREKAPKKAFITMYVGANGKSVANASITGYRAVAVPGTVLGLDTALKHYGTMKRADIMAPAIKLAKEGYSLSKYEAAQFKQFSKDFVEQPNVAAIFLKNGQPYQASDLFIQRDLAKTLSLISKHGAAAFYKGSIAKAIVKASDEHNGLLGLSDFSNYDVTINKPLTCHYRDYTVLTAPPPSGGGVTLCETLGILNNLPSQKNGYQNPDVVRNIVEALQYSFTDRNTKLGDPAFVHNPIQHLLSYDYLKGISEKISSTTIPTNRGKTSDVSHELTDTTHYAVVDKAGNAVSVTYTLNGFFGARVIAGHTGFFLNDEMDDFETRPGKANKFGLVQSAANRIQPKKRPLSSMTPTILLKHEKLYMVIGSPGGPRIISAVLLAILNVVDFNMTLQQAADAPRFHFQAYPNTIFIEPNALSTEVQDNLINRGYHITPQKTWGAIEAILFDANTGELTGANDKRRPDGAALGY